MSSAVSPRLRKSRTIWTSPSKRWSARWRSHSRICLWAPITPGEDHRLLDYLSDQYAPAPEDKAYDHALKDSVENALSSLKEREAKILQLYFGLDDQQPMTLEEIGALMGITRERVRQIKQKALIRLRHASRARFLETFF